MRIEEKLAYILDELKIRYPRAACALSHRDQLQLMVSTQLSAQCTDKMVNKVTKELYKKYKTVDDFADADINELEQDIKPTGFYKNKAKNIKNMARKLRDQYGYTFPRDLDELMKLDGVGRKTGNLFLSEAYGIPGIVVDTHVKRISKRLGLTNNTDPEKIEFDLQRITPKDRWIELGHLIITFGREICDAKKPKCDSCRFTDICDHYINAQKKASPI